MSCKLYYSVLVSANNKVTFLNYLQLACKRYNYSSIILLFGKCSIHDILKFVGYFMR